MKPKTLEDELLDLQKNSEAKRLDILRKHAVLGKLPDLDGYAFPSVHYYNLYGSIGGLHWELQRYESIAKGKAPDANLLRMLLAEFPPLPLIRWKDGCTSFRPEPDSYTSNGEAMDVDPVVIKLDHNHYSGTASVEWYANLGEDIYRMSVDFPAWQPKLGQLTVRRSGKGGEGAIVEYCQFNPHFTLNARTIRWAAGDYKTLNQFTVYWERGRNVDIPALFDK